MNDYPSAPSTLIKIALPVILIIPWLIAAVNVPINADNAWLSMAAGRLMQGLTYENGFYEPNPPLNILLYVVPAWLTAQGGHLPQMIMLWTFMIIALSALCSFILLQKLRLFGRDEIFVFMAGMTIANTVIVTAPYFGERDQFIFLGLLPFILGQLCITSRVSCSRAFLWPVLLVSAFFILIKPHYALIPVILLLYRAVRQKRFFSIALDADFIALGLATFSYIGITWIFFPEYIFVVLPEALDHYIPNIGASADASMMLMILQIVAIAFIQVLFTAILPIDRKKKYFIFLLLGLSLVCLIPLYVQGRGYCYHMFPSLLLAWVPLPLLLLWMTDSLGVKKMRFALTVLLFALLSYLTQPMTMNNPSDADIAAMPLSQTFRDCPSPPCQVFIFNANLEVAQKTLFYSGADYASRYPSLWPLPGLLKALTDYPGDPKSLAGLDILARRTAEDFSFYKPDLAIIGQFEIMAGQGPFDMIGVFSKTPAFAAEWRHYQKIKTLEVPYAPYVPDAVHDRDTTLVFDVYKRV